MGRDIVELRENLGDKYWRMNNLYMIQSKDRKTIRFRFNELQERLFRECTNRDIVLKARQQTITSYWVLNWLDDCLFNNNVEARTIADTDENLPKIFYKAKFAYQKLPDLIKELYPLYSDNKYEMFFGRRDSRYRVCLESHSDTVNRLHFSEVSFMKGDVNRKIDESTETVPMDMENTKIVFESIANGVGNRFHDMWVNSVSGRSIYKAIFFRWFDLREYCMKVSLGERKEIQQSLNERERMLISKYGLSIEQIAWRRAKIRGFSGDEAVFKVKYPEDDIECFADSGTMVFDSGRLNSMVHDVGYQLVGERYRVGMAGELYKDDRGELEIYEKPIEGVEYVLGADTGKGLRDGDMSSFYVMRKDLYQVVAKMSINTDPEVFGVFCVWVGYYYNSALLGIEKNDRGYSTVRKAVAMGYRNLYYDGMEIGRMFKEYGWHTNSRTRPLMLDQFIYDFRTGLFDKLPKSLMVEMGTFIESDKGKFESSSGCHDDEIIAISIALILCYFFPYVRKGREVIFKKNDYISDGKFELLSGEVIDFKKKRKEGKYEYVNGIL